MSKKRALGRSPAEWDRLVDEWVSSGRTQGEFAEANGINAKTFQGRIWRSRKRRGLMVRKQEPSCHFVEVSPATPVATHHPGGCCITMSKTEISFSSSAEADWVMQILSKLGH